MKRDLARQAAVRFLRMLPACVLCLWGLQPLSAVEVTRLRTEAMENPVGIDVERPSFSWTLEAGDERGVAQEAYEIDVFADAAHGGKVWSSGRVASDRQIDVPYGGGRLAPSTRYYWTVTVWDNKGREAASAENAYFETGLLGAGWDGARWIRMPERREEEPAPARYMVEADFEIERQAAGIVFSASDEDNLHLWSINVRDKDAPFLRRHVKADGKYSYTDTGLGAAFTKEELTGKPHHLKIDVDGTAVDTYVDGKHVDTYEDSTGGPHVGLVGFRAFHDTAMDETACFDNVKVTVFDGGRADGQGMVAFSEDFEGSGHDFSDGVVVSKDGNRMLRVSSTYGENCAMRNPRRQGIPMFRKVFGVKGAVKSAKIYASALGVFDLFLNGSRVGRAEPDGTVRHDELKPGWTDYRKEVNYMAYDVTPLLRGGRNAIGAQVSNGWWSGAIARGVYGSPAAGFIAKLRIEYEDGKVENVVTGTDWTCSASGPVVSGDIYDGETYDARRESGWSSPEYDAAAWVSCEESTDFGGEITAFRGQPVRVRPFLRRLPQDITVYVGAKPSGTTYGSIDVRRVLRGTETLRIGAGETALVDFGQNITGWIRFAAKGKRGTRLRFKFGEMLNDDGAAERANDGPGGSLYTYNLRTAKATLHYTMSGAAEGETFQPSTTFFGFRYCEVTASADVEISSLTGEVVGSDIDECGTLETSHPDVNRLYGNIVWSQRDNFLSIPTDCPQRDERLGWTGDTQVFARAATYNADTRAFYRKWLNDLRQSQREDGAYPEIAPFCNFWSYGTAGWADAGVIVPWTVYVMTGDRSVLAECYPSMTRYMDWLSGQADSTHKYNGAGTATGDWLAYEETDARYVSVCYYACVARLMSKIAGALGKDGGYRADSLKYAALYSGIRDEFGRRYLGADGLPAVSTQASLLMALRFGLLPARAVPEARKILRDKIAGNGYRLSTGFLGTGILNQTLSEQGMDDLAYDLLLARGNPSWLYSVDQGATTVWERWDSYTREGGFNKHPWIMNSFNHYAYGAVAEWMFRRMAGIEADESRPGFKHVILRPAPDFRTEFPDGQERITRVRALHRSGYGLVRSEWRYKDDGRISYTATVPANSTATLYLPVSRPTDRITESGKRVEKAEGVTFRGIRDGKAVMELQSGTYRFDTEDGGAAKAGE